MSLEGGEEIEVLVTGADLEGDACALVRAEDDSALLHDPAFQLKRRAIEIDEVDRGNLQSSRQSIRQRCLFEEPERVLDHDRYVRVTVGLVPPGRAGPEQVREGDTRVGEYRCRI